MKPHCCHCPVDAGLPCLAAEDPEAFGYWCPLAEAGEPIHLKMIVGRSAIATPATSRRPARESIALVERMKACPHWIPETECGCGGLARCALGRGRDGLVNHHDCFACLQSQT